jgi:hypothetical protein
VHHFTKTRGDNADGDVLSSCVVTGHDGYRHVGRGVQAGAALVGTSVPFVYAEGIAAWQDTSGVIEIELYEYKIHNTCGRILWLAGTESHTPLATGRSL